MIGAMQGFLPMRNDQAGALLICTDTLPEVPLGLDIEGAGEIVKDQQFRGACEHTSRCSALDLAARELHAFGAQYRLQPINQRLYVSLQHCRVNRLLDLALGRVGDQG